MKTETFHLEVSLWKVMEAVALTPISDVSCDFHTIIHKGPF